jgi:hypothetical protein
MTTFGKRQGGGRRRAAREPVPLVAILTGRSHSHEAVLTDLSTTGARLRCHELPYVGEDLVLNVEGLAAYGVGQVVPHGRLRAGVRPTHFPR